MILSDALFEVVCVGEGMTKSLSNLFFFYKHMMYVWTYSGDRETALYQGLLVVLFGNSNASLYIMHF